MYAQLRNLPDDTTHVFISCGGNDALRIASVLNKPAESVGHAMDVFTEIKNQFEERYSRMIQAVCNRIAKVTICTVHDSVPEYTERALTALSMFNEAILKEASRVNAPVIGAAERFIESIFKEGLNKQQRHHVHLSETQKTALNVGSRYGKPVLLKVDSKQMHEDGFEFFKTENDVCLVDCVPVKYLEK